MRKSLIWYKNNLKGMDKCIASFKITYSVWWCLLQIFFVTIKQSCFRCLGRYGQENETLLPLPRHVSIECFYCNWPGLQFSTIALRRYVAFSPHDIEPVSSFLHGLDIDFYGHFGLFILCKLWFLITYLDFSLHKPFRFDMSSMISLSTCPIIIN